MIRVSDDHFFHLRGRHVQHSHGRNTDPTPHTGAMIALMPSEPDVQRLQLRGGESPEQLHLTLYFLGKASEYSPDQQQQITNDVMDAVGSLGPVTGHVFGVNHWNSDGDEPCWVLGVGDSPESDTSLEHVRSAIQLENLPAQHTPWSPHICVAYTNDLSLASELTSRLGPVTFDRVRVEFAGEYTDIKFQGPVTAAGVLRRNPRPVELASRTDFVRMQSEWEVIVDAAVSDIASIRDTQRDDLVSQVLVAAEVDDPTLIDGIDVSDESVAAIETILFGYMEQAAQQAGNEQQRAAEEQGVEVPEWSLDAVTAAAGLSLLRSIASVASRILSTAFVQSAKRRALSFVGRPQISPEQAASEVDTHLSELTDAQPRDVIGGAVTAAQGEGRRIVLEVAPSARTYEASEILDQNVCGPCRSIDGTQYRTLADATQSYPSGGYRDCLGGTRCRGTIVAVWEE